MSLRLLRRRPIDPLVGVLIVGVIGICVFTIPHMRERERARREQQRRCDHDWAYGNAMNDPTFPFRTCRKCSLQEHLTRCLQCGRTLTRLKGGGLGKPTDPPKE